MNYNYTVYFTILPFTSRVMAFAWECKSTALGDKKRIGGIYFDYFTIKRRQNPVNEIEE
jgi:hypothetical protein